MISKRLRNELKMSGDFDRIEQELIVSVLKAGDFLQYQLRQFFREYGLTQTQYNILRILWRADEPLPVLEVANRLVSMVPGITGLVDKLEKRGLVSRTRCDADRRRWYVALTGAGSELLAQIDGLGGVHEKRLVGHLTPAESQELIRLLDKVRDGETNDT